MLHERLLEGLPEEDTAARATAAARAERVVRPPGALAALDRLAAWLAGWQGRTPPRADTVAAVLFAADHGVVTEGVSAYPQEVTAAIVAAARDGVATISALARNLGASVAVVDVGVGRPTGNLRVEPALGPCRAAEAFAAGVEAVPDEADVLVVGEMGIGNTTAAAAVSHALFGGEAADWVGRGTGVDDEGVRRKRQVVADAFARLEALGGDDPRTAVGLPPLRVLVEVGGAELVATAGALVEARRRRIPVLLDGFIVGAAAAPLHVARRGALAHCVAGHRSAEPGHRRLLERLGLDPLLDLDLRLGEGSGALLAVPLLRLAVAAVTEVATFEDLGIGRS